MRIAAISDIHVRPDKGDEALIEEIHSRVEEISPDVFVIAGDVSSRIATLADALARLRVSSAMNLFVPGNHDIWFEEKIGLGSLEKYSTSLSEVCRDSGFLYLPDAPYVKKKMAFVGSIGWYDYSFKREDLEIPYKAYAQKEWKGSIWYDLLCIDWGYTDVEATTLFNRKLEYDLSILSESVTKVVFVSHHLPFRDLTLYKGRLPWDFFSAFMGSENTGRLLIYDGRVVLAVSGHSHIRMQKRFNGIKSFTVPLGYGRPADGNYSDLARNAVAHIEIVDGIVEAHDFVEGDICEGMPYADAR
ncbi:MAG: metallophosphoesterase [Candidatus Thorarchaeota archaeon]|nr:MAG: metallophosphoesterase [Candidatus Thorarchaeota archaeon]